MSNAHFKIQQLRAQNGVCMISTVAVYMASLFTIAVLPSLIIRYFYAEQQLFDQPQILDLVPVVAFAISTLYFLFGAGMSIARELSARKLEKTLATENCCGGSCGCADGSCCNDSMDVSDEELAELESIVEEAMTKKAAKPAKKAAAKRSTKKN